MQIFQNPGLRNRHFDQISTVTIFYARNAESISIRKLVDAELADKLSEFQDISDHASKEFAIEQSIETVQSFWKTSEFLISPYKETNNFLMKLGEDLVQTLEDHIVLFQNLSFSPNKAPFVDTISELERKLLLTQEVLDEWFKCQREWMYLEPIFGSDDITKQLPVESQRYRTMEKLWNFIMTKARDNPNIFEYCSEIGGKRLLENLKECNRLLEMVIIYFYVNQRLGRQNTRFFTGRVIFKGVLNATDL